MEKTKKFLDKYCYKNLPESIDDCIPIQCNFCGATGWLPEDITHKKDCDLGEVLKELNRVVT